MIRIKEPTTVEARFGTEGKISVLSFTWQGRTLPVVSHGRRWLSEDGQHLLVMSYGERIFELVYDAATGTWHLAKAPRLNV